MTGVVDPHLLMQQHAYNLNTQLLPPQQFTSPQQQFLPPGQPLFVPPHQQFSPALQLQQHIAMQAVNGGGQQFKNATPLAVLGQGAAPADCPLCGHRAMTVVNTQIGNTTQCVSFKQEFPLNIHAYHVFFSVPGALASVSSSA